MCTAALLSFIRRLKAIQLWENVRNLSIIQRLDTIMYGRMSCMEVVPYLNSVLGLLDFH